MNLLLVLLILPVVTSVVSRGEDRIDADINSNLYVLAREECMVRLLALDRRVQREVGGKGWESNQFDAPSGLWARNGIDVFVADYGNHRIQRFDRNLNYISTLYTRESSNPDERFGYPTDVAMSRLGDLFICDGENARVVKVNRFSRVERSFGGFDAGKGRLFNPTQIETGPNDRVYVADGSRVMVYDAFGNFLYQVGDRMFRQPMIVHCTTDAVLVADSSTIYCFDTLERPVWTIPLSTLLPSGTLRSIAAVRDSMYLLTSSGLRATVFPGVERKGN
jgi:hypothetical protein